MRKFAIFFAALAILLLVGCNNHGMDDYPEYSYYAADNDGLENEEKIDDLTTEPIEKRPQGRAVQISVSHVHTLVVMEDGSLWGFGEIGQSSRAYPRLEVALYPTHIMDDVIFAVAGTYHSMAITSDGALWAWGDNFWGQIGDGTNIRRNQPVRVLENVIYAAISPPMLSSHASGGARSYAIDANGILWAWGEGAAGHSPWAIALGDGGSEDRNSPVRILENVASVMATRNGGQAITLDGRLWNWYGDWENPHLYPTEVAELPRGGRSHFEIDSNGTLWAWGENRFPSHWREGLILGDGTTIDRDEPVVILENVVYVSSVGNMTHAITTDGILWVWGLENIRSLNVFGQSGEGIWWEYAEYERGRRWLLNDGDMGIYLSPRPILENVVQVAANYHLFDHGWIRSFRSFAITECGSVWAWGEIRDIDHGLGFLGKGNVESLPQPTRIIGN